MAGPSYYFQKLLSLLRVRTVAAGLEVTDQVVRLSFFDGRSWQMHAVQFEPGVMERGVVKNREALLTGLAALKAKVTKGNKKKKMNVVACLSSVLTYTQVFSLPGVTGDELVKAVDLNLQMASPFEKDQAHSGWQIVGHDADSLKQDVLSVFIEQKVVDEMVELLFEAGFLVMAIESRALALTRVLKEKGAGLDMKKPYVFLSVDNSGIDFLIIRGGALYFEYATAWRDIMNEKGEITNEAFRSTLAASFRQVANFYSQHWTDALSAIIISATALEADVERVVAENASLPGIKLTLEMGQPISSEWLVALGCSLRKTGFQYKHLEVNLLGHESRDRFHNEQLLEFLRFWRVLVPVTMGILLVTFVVADVFLSNSRSSIEERSDFNTSGQTGELTNLETSASNFNAYVGVFATAEASLAPKNVVLDALLSMAAQKNIVLDHVSFQGFSNPISLSGTSATQDDIIAFQTALQADPRFTNINLPLTGIESTGDMFTFSMTLTFNPSAK